MLRISTAGKNPSGVTLKIEGRIVSDWVSVLEGECLRCLERGKRVRLDCADVTYIDGRGVEMLKKIDADHLEIVNSLLLEHMLRNGDRR